jgi:hypothetical protein
MDCLVIQSGVGVLGAHPRDRIQGVEKGQFDVTPLVLVALDHTQKVIHVYVPEANRTVVVGGSGTSAGGGAVLGPHYQQWGCAAAARG